MEESLRKAITFVQEERRKGKNDEEIFLEFKNRLKELIKSVREPFARDLIIKVLNEETDEGKLIDPSTGDRDINIWRWCWAAFFELGRVLDADRIIEECYLCLLRLQIKNNKRYHKGTPLQTRAEGLMHFQPSKAKRFVILAHIEDLITGQVHAPAEMTLALAGISKQDLKIIEEETRKTIDEKSLEGKTVFYPEEVFQKIHYQLDFASVGELSKNLVFTNPEYLAEQLRRVNEASEGSDNTKKCESLENLAQYLFSSIEGLYVQPSVRTSTFQLDGIITNTSNHPFLKTLNTYIPIECKNWKEPIGSPEIVQFIGKLSLYKCPIGILVSKEGIKEQTVNELRKDAYRRNNIYVLVFDERDIQSIIKGKDVISLIIEKYKELKFSINIA